MRRYFTSTLVLRLAFSLVAFAAEALSKSKSEGKMAATSLIVVARRDRGDLPVR
jgi:hypothetical protein